MTADPGPTVWYVCAVARAAPGQAIAPPAAGILPGATARLIPHRGLAAVACEVPAALFGREALEERLKDMAWVQERVLSHQAMLAGLLGGCAFAPLQFCTVYSSAEKVAGMLAERHDDLSRILDRLAGALEWGVKVYVDPAALKAAVAASAPALQPLRQAAAKASAGAAYMLRKKLELAAEKEAERASDRCAQDSHDRLAATARAAALNAIQAPDVHGRAGWSMLLNGAYLVAMQNEPRFRAALLELKAGHSSSGFDYELTGPWPPYSFTATPEAASEAAIAVGPAGGQP
jgi:hypothetical protein